MMFKVCSCDELDYLALFAGPDFRERERDAPVRQINWWESETLERLMERV